jgi:DNA-binding MarR family transcriptional regulator
MQLLSEGRAGAAHEAARVLTMLGPRLSKTVRRQLRPAAGLSLPQFITLRALGHGPKSSSVLAQIFGVSRPTVTRMVDGLAKKGLVERHQDADDRRLAIISLTAHGRALQESTEEAAECFLADLLAQLPDERISRLGAALTDLVGLLDRADASGRPRHDPRST